MRLREFAPAGGGGSGDYFQALASAWYNGTFDTGSLQKGIKSQQDVERLLNRGIVCPDGKTRKLHIDYNSDFDGVEIYSDDYYEYGDHDDTIDSRTGQKWGPYDFMAFSDEDLSEGAVIATTPGSMDPGGAVDNFKQQMANNTEIAYQKAQQGSLNEFSPDDSGDGSEEDALRNYARMWWAGDEATQMQIERALAKMGWEIGEDEGGYDNGGVFVVRAGDENGNSYQSWAAEDLTEGLTEVDRRGFLRGMGAAAVAGAAGGAKADWDLIQSNDLLTGQTSSTGLKNTSNENPDVMIALVKWPSVGMVANINPVPLPLPPAGTRGMLIGNDLVVVESPFRMLVGKQLYENLKGGIFPSQSGTGMVLAVANGMNSQLLPVIANAIKNKEEIKVEISNARKVFTFTGKNTWNESVEQGVAEGLGEYVPLAIFLGMLYTWYKNTKTKEPSFKVFINGKDVSTKLLTNAEAVNVIKNLAKQEHDTKTQYTIVDTKTNNIVFRKTWYEPQDSGWGVPDSPHWRDSYHESVEQGVAEGAPISGDGGAVDNFKQQMANNTELAYQKGMAEAKKKKKKKSSRSLGRYFFPGYGYYGSGESGEGGGDGGGGESKNRGMAEGSEDPFGPQGRFVGDTGPAQITTTVPRHEFRAGDRVMYKPTGARARIENLYKNGTVARIHVASGMGGQYFDAKVADLRPIGQGRLEEKSTSQAQFRTMAAAAHDPKFAKKVGIKQSVAREFNKADTGQDYKSLPKKAD